MGMGFHLSVSIFQPPKGNHHLSSFSSYYHNSKHRHRTTTIRVALKEWREYEDAVKDKDLRRALRFLQSQIPPNDSQTGLPPQEPTTTRDWQVLDTCLNADDMRLVASAYSFLKDKGFLFHFGRYRSIVLDGTRDVTPTLLKSSTGLDVSKLSPKKWGLSTNSSLAHTSIYTYTSKIMVAPRMTISEQNRVVVVMVPLPLHGHLNQLFHLSRLISAHNIPVHVISTTTHGRQAKLRLQGWNPNTISNIFFHDYSIPPFVSPPPNPNSTNKFPSHLQPLCESATHLRHPVATLLRKLSTTTHRLVIIHDSLMGSVVQDFVSLPNAETYTFHSVSAFSIALYTSEKVGEQIQKLVEPQSLTKDLISFEGCFTSEFRNFIKAQHEYAKLSSGRIYNTCRIVEQPILDLLEAVAKNENKLVWALGPFNPVDIKRSKVARKDGGGPVEWLDQQTSNTVIFVSFGTTTTFSQEQIIEIANGLERSHQRFIWVVRNADKGDIININNDDNFRVELPEGFEDRVKDRGLVVREWAPQLEILAHPSIGGFMSHCGWNSCIESISMGVPIVAWPMHSDQPNNAVLVTKILKVALLVEEWSQNERLVAAITVENAVKRLMGSKEGEEIRKRAATIGRRVRKSVRDHGMSQMELESFIGHITR